jgi:hypothetical protein
MGKLALRARHKVSGYMDNRFMWLISSIGTGIGMAILFIDIFRMGRILMNS